MGRQQPMHPAAEVTVSQRPERQVEVIGHDTVSQTAHGMSQFGLGQQIDKCLKVTVLMKDTGLTVAPVLDMIGDVRL